MSRIFTLTYCPILSRRKSCGKYEDSSTSRPFSYGIRKFDIGNIFPACSNHIKRHLWLCVAEICASVCVYVRTNWKKCNGRTRRHCVRKNRFSHEEYPKQSAMFNSARKYLHLNDDAGEYENRFSSINFVFPIYAVV